MDHATLPTDGVDPPLPAARRRRLVGVGVGPGDPELLTVKAIRVFAEADAILVPETERRSGDVGRAERIVRAGCPDAEAKLRRVAFTMSDPAGVTNTRAASWRAAADAADEAYAEGARTVAFATIGDPSVYSTFGYLAAHVTARRPDVEVEVVPGIMALQALAATTRLSLVEGTETLTLVPATAGSDAVHRAAATPGPVVAYKTGRRLADVLNVLSARDPLCHTVIGSDVSLPTERVLTADAVTGDGDLGYFTTVLSVPHRPVVGGSL